MKLIHFLVAFVLLNGGHSAIAFAQQLKQLFTVADEIGLTLFGHPNGEKPQVYLSPNGKYFAVWAERGRLDLNRVEDSIRFYRSKDVQDFLNQSKETQAPPSPVWVIKVFGKEGPIIDNWRWLADSSGIAFLECIGNSNQRLAIADLGTKTVELLTAKSEAIKAFDIRDRRHYVYSVTDPAPLRKLQDEQRAPVIVGTGRSILQLILPNNARNISMSSPRSYLRAVVDGKSFEVTNKGAHVSFTGTLVLSPDGHSIVTTLPVPEVPPSWGVLYPPPFVSQYFRFHAGTLDTQSGLGSAHEYVRIDLQARTIENLTDAPIAEDAGWWVSGNPTWSNDGRAVILPGTFIKSSNDSPSQPCVAVVELRSRSRMCVEMLQAPAKSEADPSFSRVTGAHFVDRENNRIEVTFTRPADQSVGANQYVRGADGSWRFANRLNGEPQPNGRPEITVKQGLDDPPLLVAARSQTRRVIWNPNPQLKNLNLGQARVYTWKDKDGREYKAGLFLPSNYRPGQRYPLVIQTHGFAPSEFRPSGTFPTAFAARALAAAGIMVLQTQRVGSCPQDNTPDEGPCNALGYETVANQLVSEGLVDPGRIGIIGFSATCFYVMEALTTDSLHFKAASITDGLLGDYLQYMIFVDVLDSGRTEEGLMGARPFGNGLGMWVEHSPGFNLEKITAPLLVVGEGTASLLSMWQPYAGLRFLHKPVDLIMLNTDEHVLTNPRMRMASQGGSVDWFRFWLQDYEDPHPAKAEQYARWRELRKLQHANNTGQKTN
jgi:poly(3-hydroxybutyrate) depolymerase